MTLLPRRPPGYIYLLAVPVAAEPIPDPVRGFTQWTVIVGRDASRTRRAGLVTFDYGIPAGARRGRGQWVCLLGGLDEWPPLAYLQHARDPRQALQVIAQAHQTWLSTSSLPRLATCPPPAPCHRQRGRTAGRRGVA